MKDSEFHFYAVISALGMILAAALITAMEIFFLGGGMIPPVTFWAVGGAGILVGCAVMILSASLMIADSPHERTMKILLLVQASLLAALMVVGIVSAALAV